jgi:transcriptional regulator with XRE-family HTH domain
MGDPQNFSDRLRRFRTESGLTQVALAQMLGVTANYVGMLEAGREPSETLLKLFELIQRQRQESQVESRGGMSPRELMRTRRLSKGLTYSELAKLTRSRADVLQAIEEGTGQAPEKVMNAICEALGIDKEQMMAGQDESIVRDHPLGTYGAIPDIEVIGGGKPKFVPLISMAQAGTMVETDFTDENYTREGVMAFDVKDRRALALEITGDSMADKLGPGSFVIFYPSEKPMPHDPVIARIRPDRGGGVLFKYYTPTAGGKRVILTSENRNYPPVEYAIEDFEWIKPVAHVITNLRRK